MDDVKNEASKFLASCGILEPPTDFHKLREARQLELTLFDTPTDGSVSPDVAESIRALIDIPDRQIFISRLLHHKKRRFASFHEIAHDVLPWHRDIFKHNCSELDLSARARKQFDIEANAFAAECLFQGERFKHESLDLKFRMTSAMQLAERYDVSLESTLRRFVEVQPEACALLVFEPRSKIIRFGDGGQDLQLKYLIRSGIFPWLDYQRGLEIPRECIVAMVSDRVTKRPVRENVILTYPPANEIRCRANILYTGYKTLVLLRRRNFKGDGYTIPLSQLVLS
jgi:hypothetical protein